MTRFVFLLVCALVFIAYNAHARVVEHTFNVGNLNVRKLCRSRVITAVNKRLPGPTIRVHEGDNVMVHVVNDSPYNITIHWHGIFQQLTAWADGPNFITQCPIVPGNNYTYRFNVTGQEGTLWWHAHASFLRATVYGAIIIHPSAGTDAYPFPKPHKEVPIILGEWWDANVVDVENEALRSGGLPNSSDAFTINGRVGDLMPCSDEQTYRLEVVQGETYLLRIINAALNSQLFFKVARHALTVVAVDASYTAPYATDVVVVAPGQTVDALMVANAPPARYYMAAIAYVSTPNTTSNNVTTTGIVHYKSSATPRPPIKPLMPAFNDTPTALKFYTSLTSPTKPGSPNVPLHIDEHMFITFGIGLTPCSASQTKCRGVAAAASMNNVSFVHPSKTSLLEAHFRGATKGVYTSDFPDAPPSTFDYTNSSVNTDPALASLLFPERGTKVKRLKYNSTVEVVLQNTALLGIENHPIHLHGFNFFVLAQGSGNYNATSAAKHRDLAHPQVRNTIAVAAGGWAVIRFTADNPGVWIMHCHLDIHLSLGLAMAFAVENGPTPSSTLPPPPPDFPRC